ncbi:hypothetical protein B0T21DRAFT_37716, partial [Apiosordaria backusii]
QPDQLPNRATPELAPSNEPQLRCTGGPDICDRCHFRAIDCVLPTKSGPSDPKLRNPSQSTRPIVVEPDGLSAVDEIICHAPSSSPALRGTTDIFATPPDSSTESGSNIDYVNVGISGSNTHDPSSSTQLSTPFHEETSLSQQAQDEPTASCNCLNNLIRVLQQLDDDEFHLATLPLDQVLQLQKWLVFQCCQPLDCPACLPLSSVHTILLVICDRLSEMFQCIHLRIKRANVIMGEVGSVDGVNEYVNMQARPLGLAGRNMTSTEPSRPQIFDGASGLPTTASRCNPLMFSDEFRGLYSNEEQIHMIRALLELQIRNLKQLLVRVEETEIVQTSRARLSKVEALKAQLASASRSIDEAFRAILEGS